MRFLSAWACGVCSTWTFVALIDGNPGMAAVAMFLVVVTFAQAMWREMLTQQVTERAVAELYESIKVEGSEEHKAFTKGLEEAIKERAANKVAA